jgi:prepilin-type N-terminal cleavage/methylation domain-containing protein
MRIRSASSHSGFTLIEVLVVVGFMGILGSMAMLQFAAARPAFVGDGAMRVVMSRLNQAREEAIGQRRWMDVRFVGNNGIQLVRHEKRQQNGVDVMTDLGTTLLEGGVQFGLSPEVTTDTPDGFGNSKSPNFGSAQSIKFDSEGRLLDAGGTPINGTIFLLIPNQPRSLRAVTVLGSIGRVRGYKWDGRQWQRA